MSDSNSRNGLTKMGSVVVGLLILLGGTLLLGWGAASKYQADLAELRAEIAEQREDIALILGHFGIQRPERRK